MHCGAAGAGSGGVIARHLRQPARHRRHGFRLPPVLERSLSQPPANKDKHEVQSAPERRARGWDSSNKKDYARGAPYHFVRMADLSDMLDD